MTRLCLAQVPGVGRLRRGSRPREAGGFRVLTLDRAGADARRVDNLDGVPTVPSMDRDEFPLQFSRKEKGRM